jgi:hypothetical protein
VITLKKLILGLLIVGSGAWAEFEVKMNIKGLYKDSFEKLSRNQQNYIYDNMDKIQSITEATLEKETLNLKKEKFIDDKNVVELILNSDGSIKEIEFLARSNERRFDNLTKKVLEEAVKSYPKPSEPTPIRMIVIYENGNIKPIISNNERKEKERYSNLLKRGTTRFEHSMSQQVREFETSKDGFINANVSPNSCAQISLLTETNQKVNAGLAMIFIHTAINVEVPKGKYKLLVQTRETCNVHIQYP